MILFQYDYTTLIQRLFAFKKKFQSVIIIQMRKYPLNPNAVVFFFKLEALKPLNVKMSYIFLFLQKLFCFGNQFLTLINDINLDNSTITVLKTWQRSYFDILPIPAPQSKTEFLEKFGLSFTKDNKKLNENFISLLLRFPYPPRTPSQVAYDF